MRVPSPVRRRRGPLALLTNHEFVGALVIAVGIAVLAVSYSAENGLPLQSNLSLSIDVPNASELTKNADVRVGGTRVGQVLTISAEHGAPGHRPFARLGVKLRRSLVARVAVDSRTTIRIASLLGGKYLALTLGGSSKSVPDGGRLGLENADEIVDLDQAFRVFDARTARGLKTVVARVGDALAGRGSAINDAIASTRELMAPLERILKTLADPRTGISRLLPAAAMVTSTLAPLADQLSAGFADAATTFTALRRSGGALGASLEALAPTQTAATDTLSRLNPVLRDGVVFASELEPGVRLFRRALRGLEPIVFEAAPILRRVPVLARPLAGTFNSVDRFVGDPASVLALQALHGHDLATFSVSLFLGLGAVIESAAQAQLHCNALGLWVRNFSSSLSDGDSAGAWLSFITIVNQGQQMQTSEPSGDLHFNPYPRENASACESGNEVYANGQSIGHPATTTGSTVARTSPRSALARHPRSAR